MASTSTGKTLREGSTQKREAILTAGREHFLADGFERTSVDAIAATAGVSKRTVYDYFGDKRTLLISVVEQAVAALGAAVSTAITENLTDIDDLEASLIGFARDITTSAIGSPDYAALMRLVSTESTHVPELRAKHWDLQEPEEAVAERFAELDGQGLLVAPDARLAADHFVALTLSPFAASIGGTAAAVRDEPDAERLIVEGVRAFLRAYGCDPGAVSAPA
ncbi:TetR/AcrR family transcriptional regulator [Plantibacter sp. YIM 135249]|uniref:TetR/AcrR family transcriptional regulator n=1 Tax=Plantibacter sp. YIM 135249 TaxID=3423918 RepID=UPI003D328491